MSKIEYEINNEVMVKTKGKGKICYIGKTILGNDIYYGIELDHPRGNSNGSLGHNEYFKCKDNHGVFVKISEISQIKLSPSQLKLNIESSNSGILDELKAAKEKIQDLENKMFDYDNLVTKVEELKNASSENFILKESLESVKSQMLSLNNNIINLNDQLEEVKESLELVNVDKELAQLQYEQLLIDFEELQEENNNLNFVIAIYTDGNKKTTDSQSTEDPEKLKEAIIILKKSHNVLQSKNIKLNRSVEQLLEEKNLIKTSLALFEEKNKENEVIIQNLNHQLEFSKNLHNEYDDQVIKCNHLQDVIMDMRRQINDLEELKLLNEELIDLQSMNEKQLLDENDSLIIKMNKYETDYIIMHNKILDLESKLVSSNVSNFPNEITPETTIETQEKFIFKKQYKHIYKMDLAFFLKNQNIKISSYYKCLLNPNITTDTRNSIELLFLIKSLCFKVNLLSRYVSESCSNNDEIKSFHFLVLIRFYSLSLTKYYRNMKNITSIDLFIKMSHHFTLFKQDEESLDKLINLFVNDRFDYNDGIIQVVNLMTNFSKLSHLYFESLDENLTLNVYFSYAEYFNQITFAFNKFTERIMAVKMEEPILQELGAEINSLITITRQNFEKFKRCVDYNKKMKTFISLEASSYKEIGDFSRQLFQLESFCFQMMVCILSEIDYKEFDKKQEEICFNYIQKFKSEFSEIKPNLEKFSLLVQNLEKGKYDDSYSKNKNKNTLIPLILDYITKNQKEKLESIDYIKKEIRKKEHELEKALKKNLEYKDLIENWEIKYKMLNSKYTKVQNEISSNENTNRLTITKLQERLHRDSNLDIRDESAESKNSSLFIADDQINMNAPLHTRITKLEHNIEYLHKNISELTIQNMIKDINEIDILSKGIKYNKIDLGYIKKINEKNNEYIKLLCSGNIISLKKSNQNKFNDKNNLRLLHLKNEMKQLVDLI